MSPKNIISSTSDACCFASSALFSNRTLWFFSLTIGPSIVSQILSALALPGLSILICVPIAIKLLTTYIVAG